MRDIGPPLFFNDPLFEFIGFGLLPQLLAAAKDSALRIWLPRCSSGEDAYSIGMLVSEALGSAGEPPATILASDTDLLALEVARRGIYPQPAVAALSTVRRESFFEPVDQHSSRVTRKLRDTIVFSSQNILTDLPFSRLDLIFARGLLGGFDAAVQPVLLSLLHFALRDSGTLVLGRDETIADTEGLFAASDQFPGIFRSTGKTPRRQLQLPIRRGDPRELKNLTVARPQPPWLQHLVEQRLLEEAAPAAVVLDSDLRIISCYGPVHAYLERPAGGGSENVVELAHSGVKSAVLSAACRALNDGQRVSATGEIVHVTGGRRDVNVVVRPIGSMKLSSRYLLMTFSENIGYGDLRRCLEKAESSIGELKEQLRVARLALTSAQK